MFEILSVPLATAVALGLTSLVAQDKTVESKDSVVAAKTADADASTAYNDVYDRLRKFKAMRLDGRPKQLADEAAKLYRSAVEAYRKGDEDEAKKRIATALDVTRSLELALHQVDENDPELPPPPKYTVRKVYVIRRDTANGELPPPLMTSAGTKPGSATREVETTVISGNAKLAATGDVRLRLVKPEGGTEAKREIVIDKLGSLVRDEVMTRAASQAEEVARARQEIAQLDRDRTRSDLQTARVEAEKARADAVKVHKEFVTSLDKEIARLDKLPETGASKIEMNVLVGELDQLKAAEARANLQEKLAGVKVDGRKPATGKYYIVQRDQADAKPIAADTAIVQLKKARDLVIKAREERKEGDGPYLDAARDLYNAARREAEAKRFDRAAELARAAELLVNANRNQAKTATADGQRLGLARVSPLQELRSDRLRIEIVPDHLRNDTAGDKVAATAEGTKLGSKENEELVGIGVMIDFKDGRAIVLDLIPEGPVAKGAKIKKGDAIVGLETATGGIIGFGDKDDAEITGLLRGAKGSKIKLIVRPSGSPDTKVYEVERDRITPPGEKKGQDSRVKGEGGGALPPTID